MVINKPTRKTPGKQGRLVKILSASEDGAEESMMDSYHPIQLRCWPFWLALVS